MLINLAPCWNLLKKSCDININFLEICLIRVIFLPKCFVCDKIILFKLEFAMVTNIQIIYIMSKQIIHIVNLLEIVMTRTLRNYNIES